MKAVIIDDEISGRNLLNELVQKSKEDIIVCAMAASADEGKQIIKLVNPDIVFLDIQMPFKSGFDMLEEIEEIDFDIVFITAYNEYAIKAIKMGAVDYLLKPIDPEEFEKTITRLSKQEHRVAKQKSIKNILSDVKTGQITNRIAISTLDSLELLKLENILFAEANGAYTVFVMENGDKHLTSRNLSYYQELLPETSFCRVHKSFLVNIGRVVRYLKGDGGSIVLTNGITLPVSRRSKEDLLYILNNQS